jgi:hypothetical protein
MTRNFNQIIGVVPQSISNNLKSRNNFFPEFEELSAFITTHFSIFVITVEDYLSLHLNYAKKTFLKTILNSNINLVSNKNSIFHEKKKDNLKTEIDINITHFLNEHLIREKNRHFIDLPNLEKKYWQLFSEVLWQVYPIECLRIMTRNQRLYNILSNLYNSGNFNDGSYGIRLILQFIETIIPIYVSEDFQLRLSKPPPLQ